MKTVKRIEEMLNAYYETFKHWSFIFIEAERSMTMKTMKRIEKLFAEYYETFRHWSVGRNRIFERSITMKTMKRIEAMLSEYYETFKHWFSFERIQMTTDEAEPPSLETEQETGVFFRARAFGYTCCSWSVSET